MRIDTSFFPKTFSVSRKSINLVGSVTIRSHHSLWWLWLGTEVISTFRTGINRGITKAKTMTILSWTFFPIPFCFCRLDCIELQSNEGRVFECSQNDVLNLVILLWLRNLFQKLRLNLCGLFSHLYAPIRELSWLADWLPYCKPNQTFFPISGRPEPHS